MFLALLGVSFGADRSVRAVRVEQPPAVDGRVIEAIWEQAAPATDFVQQRPLEGKPATEKTEVRFLYTPQSLYIGVICFDSEPDRVLDTQSVRDGNLSDSDSVLIILDTFHDRQNGFLFGTNPAGIEYDAQIFTEGVTSGQVSSSGGVGSSVTSATPRGNVSAFNINWDTSWRVRSSRTERGWESEMEIPLKSLRFKNSDGPQSWGLNVMRNIRRKNEQSFWAPIPQAYNIYRVSMAGELESLEIHAPRNLKAIPYVLVGVVKENPAKADFHKDVGLDVKYGLTPTLTLDATVNTDFAQAEVDDEQINLTRFDLFFPEKRAFFLENAGVFAFGLPREVDVFFSRRIGIDRGREVPIRAGARVTGKVDRFNLGLLSIQTGEEEGFTSAQNFLVGRVRREFQKRSGAGIIFTNRENVGTPVGRSEYNRTVGADLQLALGDYWMISGYLAKTFTPGIPRDDSSGYLYAGYKSDLWRIEGTYTEVGENFNPEMGFVPRRGFRRPTAAIYFTPSPEKGWVRQWNPHFTIRRFYGFDGKLETARRHHDLEVYRTDGGTLAVTWNRDYEFLRKPFEPHPGLSIPPGGYDSNQLTFSASSNPSARIFGETNLTFGGYYGGDLNIYEFEGGVRTGPQFVTTLSYSNTAVDARWGHFNTNLGRLKVSYSFSPTRFIQALFQYNSRAHQFSSNIRFGWVNTAGTGLYIVYNDRYFTPGEQFDTLNRAFFVKYTYQFDF